MKEGYWLTSFNVWQRIIRLTLVVVFGWQVQLHWHLYFLAAGVWRFLWDRVWPTTQFYISLLALIEFTAIFLVFYTIFVLV